MRSTRFLSLAYSSLIQDRRETLPTLAFLPFLCHLRFFEIHIQFYDFFDLDILSFKFLIDSLCISLTSPSTLEHLGLNIQFHNNTVNPFHEKLHDAWSHLDSLATHSAGSRLQRVDISIDYSYRCESYGNDGEVEEFNEDEILKSVFDGLPLLNSKGILFVKAALVGFEYWY